MHCQCHESSQKKKNCGISAARFPSKIPTWRLPAGGGVGLLTESGEDVGIVQVAPERRGE